MDDQHLDKRYCEIFNFFSIYALVVMAITVVTVTTLTFTSKIKKPMQHYLETAMILITYFLIYFQNKLLFNMCKNSI